MLHPGRFATGLAALLSEQGSTDRRAKGPCVSLRSTGGLVRRCVRGVSRWAWRPSSATRGAQSGGVGPGPCVSLRSTGELVRCCVRDASRRAWWPSSATRGARRGGPRGPAFRFAQRAGSCGAVSGGASRRAWRPSSASRAARIGGPRGPAFRFAQRAGLGAVPCPGALRDGPGGPPQRAAAGEDAQGPCVSLRSTGGRGLHSLRSTGGWGASTYIRFR